MDKFGFIKEFIVEGFGSGIQHEWWDILKV